MQNNDRSNAERLRHIRMRCAHVLDAMEWLVATERRTILCLVATVTTLLTVGIVMYTMLVVAIVEPGTNCVI